MLDDENRAHPLPQTHRYSMLASLPLLITSENILFIITIIIYHYNNNIITFSHLRELVYTTCLPKHHLACTAHHLK